MLTAAQLKSIMPRLNEQRNGELLPFLTNAMAEFAIEAPARAAAFLAQLAHESGQFRFMEEIWGPTDAQRRYEPVTKLSKDLGNTAAGDGRRFKGRGPIQLTGRANYKRFGDLLAVDLVADPPRAANPDVAFRVAGLFWSKKGLNELADLTTDDAFKEITRRINGGFNGLADRQAFYAVARRVLGVGDAPVSLERAAPPVPPDDLTFTRGHEAIRAAGRRAAAPARKAARRPPSRKKTAAPRKKAASARKTATARKKPVIAGRKRAAKSRGRKSSRSAAKKR
jgi:predicted chitinase